MKRLLTLAFIWTTFSTNAQTKIADRDLINLVSIGELHSKNPNAMGPAFRQSLDSLRTPQLSHIIDALIAVGAGDSTILQPRFTSRPPNDELILWYVIREIHYNRISKAIAPKPAIEVAKAVLSQTIDPRWMLDNYYYRIHGGFAKLFNTADLSKVNFDLDKLGFKNKTEKAIFFFSIAGDLNGRVRVLQMMKNHKGLVEFADKAPHFNGKPYYQYTDFSYPDFEWIGYEKVESYNARNIGNLYQTLVAHFNASKEVKGQDAARNLFTTSILHEPKYFTYSAMKDDLEANYNNISK